MSARTTRLRYGLARVVLGSIARGYVRLRLDGADRLPPPPYVCCFNHLSWADPFVLLALWPHAPLYTYGPREDDMSVGLRNRLIGWIGTAVPFRPGKQDLLTSTRRALAVLRDGHPLAIAGEGRLSEQERVVLPLNEGPVYFALRAQVPIVPAGISGTRWLRFGKRIRVRIGQPIPTVGRRADRETVRALTAELHAALRALVADAPLEGPPGRFGRWMTDVFSERPWLETGEGEEPRAGESGRPGSGRDMG